MKFPELALKPQQKKVAKKPMLQMSIDVKEIRELAHFDDDHSASEVLHWLRKEV